MVESVNDVETSRSIGGHRFPNFETLDAKIASVLKIITNAHFKKRVNLKEQEAQMQDRFLGGRQIAHMIYEYIRVTGAHEAVLDIQIYSLSRHMATMFKIFISDGIILCYLRKSCSMIVFWKVCTRCESESVCSSRQCWQCMNEKSFKIDPDQINRC